MRLAFLMLCALLLCNVLMRAFTTGFQVLPRILNVIDIPVVAALFLVSLAYRGQGAPPAWARTISRRLLWFCAVLFFGGLLNLEYFYFQAAASQVIMLVEPLLLFVAVVNLPFTEEQIVKYGGLLRKLIVLEITIGLLQLPGRIATGDSEVVHGTFPGNAEQYAAFLMIAVFYMIGRALCGPGRRKLYVVAILSILVLDVSIDNKASWLGTTIALALVLSRLGVLKSKGLQLIAPVVFVAGIGVFIAFTARKTSTTVVKYEKLWEIVKSGNVTELGKVKSYFDVARSHLAHPHMILVGAGPSNMYSRACRQFYFGPASRQKMYLDPDILEPDFDKGRPSEARASDSMAGVIKRTVASPYYLTSFSEREYIFAIGSKQADGPFSPYAGLLGETGLIGTWLYLSIYLLTLGWLWRRLPFYRAHTEVFPLLTSSCGMMIYILVNSIYGPFLETTRYTTLVWSMIALACIYARAEERAGRGAEVEAVENGEEDGQIATRLGTA